nr:hypothetical protein [Pseudomonas sp. BIGb0427]
METANRCAKVPELIVDYGKAVVDVVEVLCEASTYLDAALHGLACTFAINFLLPHLKKLQSLSSYRIVLLSEDSDVASNKIGVQPV